MGDHISIWNHADAYGPIWTHMEPDLIPNTGWKLKLRRRLTAMWVKIKMVMGESLMTMMNINIRPRRTFWRLGVGVGARKQTLLS